MPAPAPTSAPRDTAAGRFVYQPAGPGGPAVYDRLAGAALYPLGPGEARIARLLAAFAWYPDGLAGAPLSIRVYEVPGGLRWASGPGPRRPAL